MPYDNNAEKFWKTQALSGEYRENHFERDISLT